MWFTETGGSKIGRITTGGAITEFPIPTANSYAMGIAAGPDGALWFTEHSAMKIGRITTSGAITEYPMLGPGAPNEIATGPGPAMWFTMEDSKIGRISMGGVINEWPTPARRSDPVGIVAGPGGTTWFAERDVNRIGALRLRWLGEADTSMRSSPRASVTSSS
jgi:virginiamycin B lyase